jgi:hypothetical protein
VLKFYAYICIIVVVFNEDYKYSMFVLSEEKENRKTQKRGKKVE